MPLHFAAHLGHADMAQCLIENGALIESKTILTNKMTSLIIAASRNHKSIVNLLIMQGANVNAKDIYGATPLHHAISKSCIDNAELLLNNGAKIDERDSEGRTALYCSVLHNESKEIVQFLIDHGADVDAACSECCHCQRKFRNGTIFG